jgi:hypothetical protein
VPDTTFAGRWSAGDRRAARKKPAYFTVRLGRALVSHTRQQIATIGAMCAIIASLVAVASCGGQGSVMPGSSRTQTAARAAHAAVTATAIQLVPGTTIGTEVFPEGDTASGGQGQTINNIRCAKSMSEVNHHHVQFSLFVNGVQYAIPRGTGMKNPRAGHFIYHADCYYFLHTHDETGIIHTEAPIQHFYTLHDYFYIWGEPITPTDIAGYTGTVTVFINGVQQSIDPRTIQLTPYEQITLEVGAPVVPPPVYIFPPNYE